MMSVVRIIIQLLVLLVSHSNCLIPLLNSPILQRRRSQWNFEATLLRSVTTDTPTTIESYSFRDWNLTYRYKEICKRIRPEKGQTQQTRDWSTFLSQRQRKKQQQMQPSKTTTVIFIHPVGIGINSWFWSKLMNEWHSDNDESFDLIAPDLIGCGVPNGGDAWDSSLQPLSFPLGWVQGIEPLLPQPSVATTCNCIVVAQGGLAPVGVLLAARNPNIVTNLVLCSPPTYQDMITKVPESELERNFRFLTDPWTSNPAFWLLEQPWAIRFFSDAFLFANPCDEDWVQQAMLGATTAAPTTVDGKPSTATMVRNPVAAFNAGFCQHRSFQDELSTLSQPTLILTGRDDKRDRQGFVETMKDCTWAQLSNCCNVLPWEDPQQVQRTIQEFCSTYM